MATTGHESEFINVGGLKAALQKLKTDKIDVKADLDENGMVPQSQLPSYVDDVVELLDMTATAPEHCVKGDLYFNTSTKKIVMATGTDTWGTGTTTNTDPEKGKIYVTLDDDKTYRWGGTVMVEISKSLVIGTTTGTAADGGTVNTHITDTDIHVTATDKTAWNGKYAKPSTGIPASDLADGVIPTSLPASDVSAWAKAATKPTYIAGEVMSISSQSISANTSSSCSITGSGNAGKSETVIYVNSGSADVTVTVPTTYSTPNGAAIELTCPVGGYCEVSYLNIGGVIYARGL